MKIEKSHFRYNQRQRNGIFLLAILIITLQFVFFFVDFSTDEISDLNSTEIKQFQKEYDSLKRIELAKKKPKIYPFNPSFITDFKGYQLGMSTEEIDRLLAHRSLGKYINSTQHFQQVTGVSDSLLNRVSPYFKFPNWLNKKKQSNQIDVIKLAPIKDINLATTEELKSINGIGPKLAQRIVNYRNKLEGFLKNDQLYEV